MRVQLETHSSTPVSSAFLVHNRLVVVGPQDGSVVLAVEGATRQPNGTNEDRRYWWDLSALSATLEPVELRLTWGGGFTANYLVKQYNGMWFAWLPGASLEQAADEVRHIVINDVQHVIDKVVGMRSDLLRTYDSKEVRAQLNEVLRVLWMADTLLQERHAGDVSREELLEAPVLVGDREMEGATPRLVPSTKSAWSHLKTPHETP